MYHVIIYTPLKAADTIREAAAKAGAGHIGNYDSCSFSVRGTGRFRPLKGADPAIGEIGKREEVDEERIELMVTEEKISSVLNAILKVHPYEEPAIHVLKMEDYKKFNGK